MNELDLIVEDLIENNLMWRLDYKIPVIIVDGKTGKGSSSVATIYWKPFSPDGQGVTIYDLRNGGHFPSFYLPEKILFNGNNLESDEHVIRQILLHELNHWYTYENDSHNVQAHGKEFKRNGRLIGLEDKYNRAVIKLNENQTKYYIARCVKCGGVACATTTRKELDWNCKMMYTSCCRADMKFDRVYVYTENE